jgi:phosphoglycerate dehydrogenase-like enzyme
VTEPEPLPRDHPLHAFENVIIVPHRGSATRQVEIEFLIVISSLDINNCDI